LIVINIIERILERRQHK